MGKYLEDRGVEIKYGIKTGFNQAFVIDRETRDCLIAEDPRSAEIIKPFVVGKDIHRYRIDFRERYLIFTRHGIDIKQYPAIKAYLARWKEQLTPKKKKDQPGPGRKPSRYKWYEIQDAVDYYELFEKPKIVYPVIAKEPRFAIDVDGLYFCNDKAFIIPLDDLFLLAALNSKPCWFYLKRLCSVLGDAEKGGRLELRDVHIRNLPIPKVAANERYNKLAIKTLEELAIQTVNSLQDQMSRNKDETDEVDESFRINLEKIDRIVWNFINLTV